MSDEIKVSSKRGRGRKILIGVVAVIVIALVAVLAVLLPKSAEAKKVSENLDLGDRYLSELDYEQAVVAYLAVIEIDPKNVDALIGLADAYLAQGEYEEAIDLLEDALDELDDDAAEDIEEKLEEVLAAKKAAEVTPAVAPTVTPTPEPTATPTPEPTSTPTPTPGVNLRQDAYTIRTDENGNVYDLGGMEIVIRDWWSSGERTSNNAYEEARWEYIEWAEETYNFTIREVAMGAWGTNAWDFIDYVTVGGNENYIFALQQNPTTAYAMHSELMYDLATLDCLDFTEDKWKSDAYILMQKGSSYYGMRGVEAEPRGCVFFNKRLLMEAGINPQDIYRLQENGEWTWEKFEEICQQVQRDIDGDGVIDVYAMVQQSAEFAKQAVFANGGSFIGKTEDGKYFNNLESAKTMEALNWSVAMKENYEMPQPEGSNWDYFVDEFQNGSAVFYTDQAYRAAQIVDSMEDEFGCVVFPMGPAADDYISYSDDVVYCIPACYDEEKAWKLAFAYDLYTEPVPGFEDSDYWKGVYYGDFCDTESVDLTLERLVNGSTVMHYTMVPGIDIGIDLLYGLGYDNTPAQQAEALREAWNSYIDEANQ